MRNSTFRIIFRFAVILIAILVLSPSCKKDDDDNSGYYGKWMAKKAVPNYDGYGAYTERNYFLTIYNTNTFNESFYANSGSGYMKTVIQVSIDGSVFVLENQMQFNVEKISISNYDFQKEKVDPPFNIITNSQGIENTLNGLVKVTSGHNAEFSLNGNELTLSVDYDENGDFLDSDEILTYTRQK